MPALTTHYRSLTIQTVLASGLMGPGFILDASWHLEVQVTVPDGLGGYMVLTPPPDGQVASIAGWFPDQMPEEENPTLMLFSIVVAKSGRTGKKLLWQCPDCRRECTTLYSPVVRLVSGHTLPVSWKCRKCYGLQYPRTSGSSQRPK